MALTDPEKYTAVQNRLNDINSLLKGVSSIGSATWIRNIAKQDIDLKYSKRLMVGPPIATSEFTVGQLQDKGVWGLYEMAGEASREIYEKTFYLATDTDLQQTDNPD